MANSDHIGEAAPRRGMVKMWFTKFATRTCQELILRGFTQQAAITAAHQEKAAANQADGGVSER